MKNTRPTILLLLIASVFPGSMVSAAGVGQALHCAGANSLRAAATSCDGNTAYSDSARLCVESYEQAIADARLGLARALAGISSGERQGAALANAKSAYEGAIASLKSLVVQGTRLKAEIDAYKGEVVFPEDFESVGVAGFSPQAFLDSSPCYKSTQDLLATYSSLMASRAKELELTSQIAGALASKAFKGELSLDAEGVLPLLSTGNPAPGGGGIVKPGAGKSARSQSDVTGTGRKRDELPGSKKK